MRALYTLVFAAVLGVALSTGAHGAGIDASIASLRQAVARHPGDWQLSWSLAQALEAAGRPDEAAEHIQRHLERWPDRPPDGWLVLGRCAYRAGRVSDAVPALERALAHDPGDAEARLYLGLSLRQLGQREAAERSFEAAAAQDARFAGEGLLLSGMSRLSRGDTDGGRELLRRVLERAPQSASARDARRLLADPEMAQSDFEVKASAGALYDSNVTLEEEGDVPGAGSPDGDARFDFLSQLTWRPTLAEARPVQVSVAYGRSDYVDLTDYSSQTFGGSVAGLLPLGDRAALRLDTGVGYALVDDEPYLLSGAVRPSVYVALGRRTGVLRLHAGGERLEYDEDPQFDSLERSGWTFGGGAEHLLPLGQERQTWITWGASYQRRITEAGSDSLCCEANYDGDRYRASLRGSTPVLFGVSARAELHFDVERYDNRSVIDGINENNDFASPQRRRDFVWNPRLSLRRALYRGVELEVFGSYTDRASNVELYGYQRAQTGVRLHATLP